MRVTLSWRREDGIASLLVAVSLVSLIGSAAVAVDLGNLWNSRRRVIVATDAGSLAAAADYAVGLSGCGTAGGYVADNDPAADMTSCNPAVFDATSGYVTVDAETPVDYAFAGALGFPDRTVSSSTTAAWGLPAGVNGLRPFGLCEEDPYFQAWTANPRGILAPAKVPFTHDGTDCGDAPGNWAIIDLDNAGNVSNSDTQQWVRYGYDGRVRPGDIGGSPGAFSNSFAGELATVRGERFPIPVFDRLAINGANARFHVVAFVGIELVSWKTTGSQHDRYLEVRFTEMVVAGECCDRGSADLGLRVVHICEVDPDFVSSNCRS